MRIYLPKIDYVAVQPLSPVRALYEVGAVHDEVSDHVLGHRRERKIVHAPRLETAEGALLREDGRLVVLPHRLPRLQP
jgi:hypothetical protein